MALVLAAFLASALAVKAYIEKVGWVAIALILAMAITYSILWVRNIG